MLGMMFLTEVFDSDKKKGPDILSQTSICTSCVHVCVFGMLWGAAFLSLLSRLYPLILFT